MAKKTATQTKIEQITKDSLNELGRKVSVLAARMSKVSKKNKRHLRDTYNYRVKPFHTLAVTSTFYGQYNTPKGKPTPKDRTNLKNTAMKVAVNENVEDEKKVFIKNMSDYLMMPVKK